MILIEDQLFIENASQRVQRDQTIAVVHKKKHIHISGSWVCVSVNALDMFHTCMDTCQGQELGLARSPFTIRASRVGGMAGFPQVLGQS